MAWSDPQTQLTFATSEIVTATKLNKVRDDLDEVWRRLAYVEFTSDVTTTTATEASPLDVVSAGAISFEAKPIRIEFFTPALTLAAAGAISLWDASTDLGRLSHATTISEIPTTVSRILTPSAASHTYKIRIWQTGGSTSRARAGAGGVGTMLPGYIAIWAKGGT